MNHFYRDGVALSMLGVTLGVVATKRLDHYGSFEGLLVRESNDAHAAFHQSFTGR
ncbi:MAG: hypothetical protein GY811_16435 [Myxococcales bacterium]|nr:hypothetical protein [Myxococcales bacterium]